jgi:arsenite/tail-anchored protein-transporting ATPase
MVVADVSMRALLERRILFFGGKGGVGKTTCASAVALAASRLGKRVLLVSTDPAHSTSDVFETSLAREEREIAPGLWGLEVDAAFEVEQYLGQVRRQLSALFSAAVLAQAIRQVELAATMPGVTDVAVFDRLAALIIDRLPNVDLLVFDTAPTGHTLQLLHMPELMSGWVDALVARRRHALSEDAELAGDGAATRLALDPVLEALERRGRRLTEVRAQLTRPGVAAFVMVLTPERLPIEETARAVKTLREAQIDVGALVVNRVLPDGLEGDFYRARRNQERVYRDEIDTRFADWPRLSVPQFEADIHGVAALTRLGAHLVVP